uniref:Protein HGH1 homolog n=1 Tax=Lotharella oceanica TaxID=641309 RepID=A0A7S2TMN9_9EUKA
MNEQQVEAMAFCLKKMANDETNRGVMVQQKGIRLLSELYNLGAAIMDASGGPDSKKGMWREDCAVALARIAISTNPQLYPQGSMLTMVRPLMWLFGDATHELHQFEAGLGLTNIASVDADTRDTLVMHGAWSALTNLLASDNEQVQRVGVECMANLVMCERSIVRLRDSEQDIKLFIMFAKAEDMRTKLAATGGLAMMTQDPDVAKAVAKQNGVKELQNIKIGCRDVNVAARVDMALANIKEALETAAPQKDDPGEKLEAK